MSVSHKELMRRLRKLGKAIEKHIDAPNYGGCGVIAGIVGKHLADLGLRVEVVTPVGTFSKPAAKVRGKLPPKPSVSDWTRNGLSNAHLAVRFCMSGRCWTWDSQSLRRGAKRFGRGVGYRCSDKFGDGLTVEECQRMASLKSGWNSRFDRRQIPDIEALAHYHVRLGL